jgi:hypothetical protein
VSINTKTDFHEILNLGSLIKPASLFQLCLN